MKTKLTPEHAKRVRAEIAECQKKIKREMSFSKDLRHEWRIKELEELIIKLRGMLVDGVECDHRWVTNIPNTPTTCSKCGATWG